jgi:branched-chain amino acid transport system substrate-binding protein
MVALLAAGAIAVAGVAAACDDDDDDGGGGDGGGAVGELDIGVLVPLSGDLSPFGGPGAEAAELAAETVNAAATEAGVDLTVTLSQEDTKTDPQGAQEAATKLVESTGVSAIAGPWASSETIPTAENVTIPAGVPIVSPSATSPDITGLDDDNTVFRTAPSDALQGQVIAQVMADEFGAEASVITAHRNDAYGNALVGEFTKSWEAGGGTVSSNVSYNPEAPSLDSEAGQIASDTDAWMVIDFPDSWQKMGPALVRTGNWDPARTFTADGLRDGGLPGDAGEEATEGLRGTAPSSKDAPAEAAFAELWDAEIGGEVGTFAPNNFDAVILIALAAAAAGSSDRADIAANIPAVSGGGDKYTFENLADALTAIQNGEDIDYEGVSGPLDLDENGDPGSSNYGTWSYTGGELVDSDEVFTFGGEEG